MTARNSRAPGCASCSGVCPACGSPIDPGGRPQAPSDVHEPACNLSYQAALHERFEVSGAPDDRPGSARLPPGRAESPAACGGTRS